MLKIIDGKKIASEVKTKIAKQVFEIKNDRPSLAIILVGKKEDSTLYVSLKEREAKKVGIDTHTYKLAENVSEQELIEVIEFLNDDNAVDGILIQLPLPEHINTDNVVEKINPLKDADGFHPLCPKYITSPVLASIKASLDFSKEDLREKSACILYNSSVFGDSIKKMLIEMGVNSILEKKDSNKADILISAIGKPASIKKDNIKEGAILIDISTVKVDGKIMGDVDFDDVKDKASFLTPVPGGIGPMTIAFLLKNVLELYKENHKC